MKDSLAALLLLACAAGCGGGADPAPPAPSPFVHWETAPVHPVALTPSGNVLCVCNTADARLELFDVSGIVPIPTASIAVGLDPVSVRLRSEDEAWVVNRLSDSVSVVDLRGRRVVATLQAKDEPGDIVFAGNPPRAFVSCATPPRLLVFDPERRADPPEEIAIEGVEPRALARSADGTAVYVALFLSGNGTTILGGQRDRDSAAGADGFPPDVVDDPEGPHGGANPPPNGPGGTFVPAANPANPPPPRAGLIVRRDGAGRFRDDTGADWTEFVSGAKAARSGRLPGWELLDHDVAVVDTASRAVAYRGGLMNVCMALAVDPKDGALTVVGTDAANEIRYEPNLAGRFLRVVAARSGAGAPAIADLNPHLDYLAPRIPQAERDRSVGDPRAIVWNAAGDRAYVAGMGSRNVAVLDGALGRVGLVEVGEGPCGLALDEARGRLYVLNRFSASVSVVATAALSETARAAFFDPTPAEVKRGRRHLYDTRRTSGLGQAACASCHVDARIDRLAWDLGDPAGAMSPMDQNCLTGFLAACEDFHPMKGPMTTQTLQDIVGHEPFHWRGDRNGLEEFNGAFVDLMGDDAMLTPEEMAQFEAFLATISIPPNPFRNLDNTLPGPLPLDGHYTTGRFAPAGQPLPPGDPGEGLRLFREGSLDGGVPGFNCVTCHTLPTGMGTDLRLTLAGFEAIPAGPDGERHHALVSVDGGTNVSVKIPQLRNAYQKTGFETTRARSLAGFGFFHDGSVDSLARFMSEPIFSVASDQEVADLVAFLLCFGGGDLPTGDGTNLLEPTGPAGKETHAAVGRQTTLDGGPADPALATLVALAAAGRIDLIAKGRAGGAARGWLYDAAAALFLSDREGESLSEGELRALAAPGSEITFTAVPAGMGRRMGIDRDDDGVPDRTEIERGRNPALFGR